MNVTYYLELFLHLFILLNKSTASPPERTHGSSSYCLSIKFIVVYGDSLRNVMLEHNELCYQSSSVLNILSELTIDFISGKTLVLSLETETKSEL